jgi:carboxypeptidase C (cathepsin A)
MRWFLCLFVLTLFAGERVTTHTLQLPRGPISYSATLGSTPARNQKGEIKGAIGYTAYIAEPVQASRPITFLFNGGPGSSSIWLHMGALGPRRVLTVEEGQGAAPPYGIVDNQETLLEWSDLVFIDPMGTGFSKADTPEDEKSFWSVQQDLRSVGECIRDFLTKEKRWNSPLYIAGESYGALRASGLAGYLHDEGIYLNGILLISSALDLETFNAPQAFYLYFPTYVTTAWYHGRYSPGSSVEEAAAIARKFTAESLLPYLFNPTAYSSEEKETLWSRMAELSGLPVSLIKKRDAQIGDQLFFFEFFPEERKRLGRYDTRFVADYADPFNAYDPSYTNITGILTTAFHQYLHKELDADSFYKAFCEEAHHSWHSEGHSFWDPAVNFKKALQSALTSNPSLKVFVGSGYFDGATPFAATESFFNTIDLPDSYRKRIQMEYYDGGHMYYLNPTERVKFKEDLKRFYFGN